MSYMGELAQQDTQMDGATAFYGLLFLFAITAAVVLLVQRYPNYRSSGEADTLVTLAAVLLAMFTLGYMLPSSVAIVRKVPNVGSIIVINFFLGWTVIGWVIALAMAARSRTQPQQTDVVVQPQTTVTRLAKDSQTMQPPPPPTVPETPAIPPPPKRPD